MSQCINVRGLTPSEIDAKMIEEFSTELEILQELINAKNNTPLTEWSRITSLHTAITTLTKCLNDARELINNADIDEWDAEQEIVEKMEICFKLINNIL